MTPHDFRILLKSAGLRQKRLAELLEVDPATVNVWCNEGPRHIPPPAYAIKFIRSWMMLTPEQRDQI